MPCVFLIPRRTGRQLAALAAISVAVLAGSVPANLAAQEAQDRIAGPIDEARRIVLDGGVHPLAQPQFDCGPISADTPLQRMVLVLSPSQAQQAALDKLLIAQHTPGDPNFHQWLTTSEFGARFGVSANDLTQITQWLEGHGFTIDEIAASRLLIQFSGTEGAVEEAFHTELHCYTVPTGQSSSRRDSAVDVEEHIANMRAPQIPAALKSVIRGVLSLHNFRAAPVAFDCSNTPGAGSASAQYTDACDPSRGGAIFRMMPALYALHQAGSGMNLDGTGATVAIVSRTGLENRYLETAPAFLNLKTNPPLITPAVMPSRIDSDTSSLESDPDGQKWVQAETTLVRTVASGAALRLVAVASTSATDGLALAAQYAVNHLSAQVLVLSPDLGPADCGAETGSIEAAFYQALMRQAAAQGMTVSTASGCDTRPTETRTSPESRTGASTPCASSSSVSEARILPPIFAGMSALLVQANGGAGLGHFNAAGCDVLSRSVVRDWPADDQSETLVALAHRAGMDADEIARIIPFPHTPERVRVKVFNPDPTGNTDATADFQAAFDSATGTVAIPAGTYLLGCTNPLYLSRNNITYIGAGEGKTIFRSCQGHTVPVTSWTCKPASGISCTAGKGPYTFTVTTATPLLQGIDTYYCPQVGVSDFCALETWHGEFPGFTTLAVQFLLSGAGIPPALSTTLANPIFPCGPGCGGSPANAATFQIVSTIAPIANSGNNATFSLPQNVIQAYDARSNTRQTGSHFTNITFDGGCDQCAAASFDTGLIDMGNPRSSARETTANSFNHVTFSNYSAVAMREDRTDGDTFQNITFTNAGQNGIIGDSPSNLTIANVTAANFGWQKDVRVIGSGANYSSTFDFGCTTGGHSITIQNISVAPSRNSEFVGFAMFCGSSTAQTATTSAYSDILISSFTINSAGNRLLPISAFADKMTIHGFSVQGYPDPLYASNPYMEIAGSDLNLYGNKNVSFYFAPIDEGAYVDGGVPVHTRYARINIHDNAINCTAPTQANTGCFGIAIGGFQNQGGDTMVSYIDTVTISNNTAAYSFGTVNGGNVVHIVLGANEGGSGTPVGQLTNVHVSGENVTISGSQSQGGGWSAFATLWGNNQGNANWQFDHDAVQWSNTTTLSDLEHFRATQGVVASGVTAQSESTPASPLLTNDSGGSFQGVTILQ